MGRIGFSHSKYEPLGLTSICVWPESMWDRSGAVESESYDHDLIEGFIRPFTNALDLSNLPDLKGGALKRWLKSRIVTSNSLKQVRMIGQEELEARLYESVHECVPGAILGIRDADGESPRAVLTGNETAAPWAVRPDIEFVVDLPIESAHAVLFLRSDRATDWMSRLGAAFKGAGQTLHHDDLRLRTVMGSDKAISEGHHGTALEFWHRRMQAEPWNAPLHVERAMVYAQMGSDKAARKEFSTYLDALKQWKRTT